MNARVHRVAAVLLLAWCASSTAAADYPTKPARLVVAYPPGGGIDLLARVMGQQFAASWRQQMIVDNRRGAGTTIGAAVVAKALPDGYTLLLTDVSFTITGKKRAALLLDLPTVAESGLPDYDVSAWYGLLAPAGTPRPMIRTVHLQVKKALQAPGVQQQLAGRGSEAVGSTPKQFSVFIASEIKKWRAAVMTAGAKVD